VTETGELRLGFVPLNDAAPLLVAQDKGFFAAEGLRVALSREVSWATVRDKVAAGALDGAHMLAPMVLAASLGAGSERRAMIAPLALNLNGAAVTVSAALAAEMRRLGGGAGARPLAQALAARRQGGASPPTFAVVFPYSMHNYLLRYWLAEAGIDPDRDVRLAVAPPSRMAGHLAAGDIEGFCVGEPWNAVAVRDGVGEVAVRASEVWRAGPEKVFGVTDAWAQRNPDVLAALLRALVKAAAWADAAENRGELVALLAGHVDAPPAAIEGSLDDIAFHRDGAGVPQPVHAAWLLSQMMRWGQVASDLDIESVARRVYRPDLFAAAAGGIGDPAPILRGVADGFFDGRTFRMDAAADYAASLPLSRVDRS
jgi:NitT/TauT family transport system ATP-binding protein/nitrate/nitrite transport system substrate-binding protein